ncbi:hypothetical protein WA026_001060 [Henosepilachna vigintioctopunctata]|uniref:Uncharacterized protein n=1 Tax=Henosepilachna vigintioctopunctata TaxID=420089 RepID=A0AAW1V6W2_9CUCU
MNFSRSVAFLSTSLLILVYLSAVQSAPACGENWWNKIKPSEKSCMLGHLIEVLSHLLSNNQQVCQCQCNKSPASDQLVGPTKLPEITTPKKISITEEPDFCDDDALSLGIKKSTPNLPPILSTILDELKKSQATEEHETTGTSSTTEIGSSYPTSALTTTVSSTLYTSPSRPEETSTNPSDITVSTEEVTTRGSIPSSVSTSITSTSTEKYEKTTIGKIPSEDITIYPEKTTIEENEATTLRIIPSSIPTTSTEFSISTDNDEKTTIDITHSEGTTIHPEEATTKENEATTLGLIPSSISTTTTNEGASTEKNEKTTIGITPSVGYTVNPQEITTEENGGITLGIVTEENEKTTIPGESNTIYPQEITTKEVEATTLGVVPSDTTTISLGTSCDNEESGTTTQGSGTAIGESKPTTIVTILNDETTTLPPIITSTDEIPVTSETVTSETTPAVITTERSHEITPEEASTVTSITWHDKPVETTTKTTPEEIHTISIEISTSTRKSDTTTPSEIYSVPPKISTTTEEVTKNDEPTPTPENTETTEEYVSITVENTPSEISETTPDIVTSTPKEVKPILWGTPETSTNREIIITTENCETETLGMTPIEITTLPPEITGVSTESEPITSENTGRDETTPTKSITSTEDIGKTTLSVEPSEQTTPSVVTSTALHETTSLGIIPSDATTQDIFSTTGTNEVTTLGPTISDRVTVSENVEISTLPCTDATEDAQEESTPYFTTLPPEIIYLSDATEDTLSTLREEHSTEPATITITKNNDLTTSGATEISDATTSPSNGLETIPTTEKEIIPSTQLNQDTTVVSECNDKISTDSPEIVITKKDNEAFIVGTPGEITGIPVEITITERNGKTSTHKIITNPTEWEQTTYDPTEDDALSLFFKTSSISPIDSSSTTEGNPPHNTEVTIDDAETLGNTPAEVYTTPIDRTTTQAPDSRSEHSPIIFPTDTTEEEDKSTTLEPLEATSASTPSENTQSSSDKTERPEGSDTTPNSSTPEIITISSEIDVGTLKSESLGSTTESAGITTVPPETNGIPTERDSTTFKDQTWETIPTESLVTTEPSNGIKEPGTSVTSSSPDDGITAISNEPTTTEKNPEQYPENSPEGTTTTSSGVSSSSHVSETTDITTAVESSSPTTMYPSTNSCADEDCNNTTCEEKPRVLLVPVVEYKGPCLTEKEFRNYLYRLFDSSKMKVKCVPL